MRRGTLLRTKLARIALAYALALQALLGAWAGHAGAAHSQALDPASVLCRTLAAGEAQQSRDETVPAPHCAVMCLSGACAAADPPIAASVAAEFSPPRFASISIPNTRNDLAPLAPGGGLNARGPPSIA